MSGKKHHDKSKKVVAADASLTSKKVIFVSKYRYFGLLLCKYFHIMLMRTLLEIFYCCVLTTVDRVPTSRARDSLSLTNFIRLRRRT